MYECLVGEWQLDPHSTIMHTESRSFLGYPPFCSESPHQTYQKIIKWEDYLQIPKDVDLSREAEGMIRG